MYSCEASEKVIHQQNVEYNSKQIKYVAKACDSQTKLAYVSIETAPHNLFKLNNQLIFDFFNKKEEEIIENNNHSQLVFFVLVVCLFSYFLLQRKQKK